MNGRLEGCRRVVRIRFVESRVGRTVAGGGIVPPEDHVDTRSLLPAPSADDVDFPDSGKDPGGDRWRQF
jgi:hypothetical protein